MSQATGDWRELWFHNPVCTAKFEFNNLLMKCRIKIVDDMIFFILKTEFFVKHCLQ